MTLLKKHKLNPNEEIIGILRFISGQRKSRAFFMRKCTANLIERLSEEEQDAMMEIALAHKIICGTYGLKQWRYEIQGKSENGDFSSFAIDMIRKFREWSKVMARDHPDILGICIAICTDEESIAELSRCRKMRWENTLILLRRGFLEWSKVAEW